MLLGMLFADNCYAQESKIEEWPGTLKRDGKQKESVIFLVKISDKGPFIMKMIYADTPFEFKQQEIKGDTLTFYWTPGDDDVKCELKREGDDKYVGTCLTEDSDNKIEMRIKQSKQASKVTNNKEQDNHKREDKEKNKESKKEES